ncbi:hypothetical protein TNCV_4467811 [Trichonephila clavipes]|nr:hypothetical protein TNCV_4467811 [Trichonephila clavipes]
MTRVSQDCLRTVTSLSWSDRSQDLSPIEHIWDHLGRQFGHPTRLNELETRYNGQWQWLPYRSWNSAWAGGGCLSKYSSNCKSSREMGGSGREVGIPDSFQDIHR